MNFEFQTLTGRLSHLDSGISRIPFRISNPFQTLTGRLSHLDVLFSLVHQNIVRVSNPDGTPQPFRLRDCKIVPSNDFLFQTLTGRLSHLDCYPYNTASEAKIAILLRGTQKKVLLG
jgi:hypothetical protein